MQLGRSGNIPVEEREKGGTNMNKVILMGRLTADPETRYTPNNVAIARFTLAVNRNRKPQEGQPSADFINIVAWQKTADFVTKYFKKGQQVLVEGRMQNNNYTDKEGVKHFNVEVHVDQAYFADSKRDSSGGDTGGYNHDYGNGGGNAGGSNNYQGGNAGGSSNYQSGNQGGGNAPSNNNNSAPAPDSGDGFYTLNEDDEDLPF